MLTSLSTEEFRNENLRSEDQFHDQFLPFLKSSVVDLPLLERFHQIPEEIRKQSPLHIAQILSDWLRQVVENFEEWKTHFGMISRLCRIYFLETTVLERVEISAVDLIIESYHLAKLLINGVHAETKNAALETILGVCQVVLAIADADFKTERLVSALDCFFELAHLSLFSSHWLEMISAEEHFALILKFTDTVGRLSKTEFPSYVHLARRLFDLGKRCFEFVATKLEKQNEYRVCKVLNVCFKDLIRIFTTKEFSEEDPVLFDCFRFLISALLATSSTAFQLGSEVKMKLARFWLLHLRKMVDTFSHSFSSFLEDITHLCYEISCSLILENEDSEKIISFKRGGVDSLLDKLARCLLRLLANQEETLVQDWFLALTAKTDDRKDQCFPLMLLFSSMMKSAKIANDGMLLMMGKEILRWNLSLCSKLLPNQAEKFFQDLKIYTMNGALKLFYEGINRQDTQSAIMEAFRLLSWTSNSLLTSLMVEFWTLVFKKLTDVDVQVQLRDLLHEIKVLCMVYNALLLDTSAEDAMESSILTMIYNASYTFTAICKGIPESIADIFLHELSTSSEDLASCSSLAVLAEFLPNANSEEIEDSVVQNVVKIGSIVLGPKKQSARTLNGLYLYWNLRLLVNLHRIHHKKQNNDLNYKVVMEICETLFSISNLEIKSKIWSLILKESLEFMNLRFKDVKNWPRIEQSLLPHLRSTQTFHLIFHPVFDMCKIMADHNLSPQRDLMHCLWSNSAKNWYVERLCFEATIAASRSKKGSPVDLVPLSVYNPESKSPDQTFRAKMSALLNPKISLNQKIQGLEEVDLVPGEESLLFLDSSITFCRTELLKLTKKRRRSRDENEYEIPRSWQAVISSMENTAHAVDTFCKEFNPYEISLKQRQNFEQVLSDYLTTLKNLSDRLDRNDTG